MSAFLQASNVGFAGRPPARPGRNGHSFHRGQLMPNVNLERFGGQSPPETAGDFRHSGCRCRVFQNEPSYKAGATPRGGP